MTTKAATTPRRTHQMIDDDRDTGTTREREAELQTTDERAKEGRADQPLEKRRAKAGEIVFYNTGYHAQNVQKRPTALPAMVVWVNGDGSVNLTVFTDEGRGTEVQRNVQQARARNLQEKAQPNTFTFQNEEPVKTTKEQDESERKLPTATLDMGTRESQQAYEDRKAAEARQSDKAKHEEEERLKASA